MRLQKERGSLQSLISLWDEYGITLQSLSKSHKITRDNISDCGICRVIDDFVVDAIQLKENVRVRTSWGDLSGRPGDYLIVIDMDDYYVHEEEIFKVTYEIL